MVLINFEPNKIYDNKQIAILDLKRWWGCVFDYTYKFFKDSPKAYIGQTLNSLHTRIRIDKSDTKVILQNY